MTEQRFVLGVAYQAGLDPDIKKGADGFTDYFSPEELEKAARSFLRKGGMQSGLFHVDGTELDNHVEIVESYIYRQEAPWIEDGQVFCKKGDWLVGAILDETAWNLVKQGHITGWSIQGLTKRRPVRSSTT